MRARPAEIALHFGLEDVPELSPRFNAAPGQDIATVRIGTDGRRNVLEMRRWGLVPGWAKNAAIGNRMINARSETAREKPAFRSAFARRRCLIPTDGFYEWSGGAAVKQPWYIARPDRGLFALAGLWEEWQAADGAEVHSCSVLTTAANATLADIHDRMPVILAPGSYPLWLAPDGDPETRFALLVPCADDWLERHTVGLRVNDPRSDDPGCLAPAPPQPQQGLLL